MVDQAIKNLVKYGFRKEQLNEAGHVLSLIHI